MSPSRELSAALEAVYTVFARYPKPDRLEASPLYGRENFLEPLLAAPLRDLTCDQVGVYAGKALTTVGQLSDYKHFLPRLLEHVIDERCAFMGLSPDEFAHRVIYGGWPTWPDDERQAVLSAFRLASDRSAKQLPNSVDPDTWREALELLNDAV